MSDAAVILSQLPLNPTMVEGAATAPQGTPNGGFAGIFTAQLNSQQGVLQGPAASPAGLEQMLPASDLTGQGLPLRGNTLPPVLPPAMVSAQLGEPGLPLPQLTDSTETDIPQVAADLLQELDVTASDLAVPLDTAAGSQALDVVGPEHVSATPGPLDAWSTESATPNPRPNGTAATSPSAVAIARAEGQAPAWAGATGLQPGPSMSLSATAAPAASAQETEGQSLLSTMPLGMEARLSKALQSAGAQSVHGTLQTQQGGDRPASGLEHSLRLLEGAARVATLDPSFTTGAKPARALAADGLITAAAASQSGGQESGFWGTLTGVTQSTTNTQASSLPLLPLNTPAQSPNWSQDLGQRITWMAGQELKEAQIQMNPRHLGPIEVRISYGHEQQMTVNFVAHNSQARDMLDAALPRLREMFESQGLNLADANVSQESFGNREQTFAAEGSRGQGRGYGRDETLAEDDTAPEHLQAVTHHLEVAGLFNAYA